jgi:cysteinyl-tRNA synthetase
MTPEEKGTIQTMVMGNNIFYITQEMLQIDQGIMQKKLKDIEQLDLAMSKIPNKVLYKLQMSVAQEVKSRARTNEKNLETIKEEKEILEITLKEVQIERDEEKQCAEKLEQTLEEVFQTILDIALAEQLNAKENIQWIA